MQRHSFCYLLVLFAISQPCGWGEKCGRSSNLKVRNLPLHLNVPLPYTSERRCFSWIRMTLSCTHLPQNSPKIRPWTAAVFVLRPVANLFESCAVSCSLGVLSCEDAKRTHFINEWGGMNQSCHFIIWWIAIIFLELKQVAFCFPIQNGFLRCGSHI